MKTVAKVAAVVAGVALIGSGIGSILGGTMVLSAFGATVAAGTIATIASAVSFGASLLASKPKPPQNSDENIDRLRANVDPRTPRKTVVGHTALATDIRDEEFTSSQTYFHRFIVCASHKVQSIDEIWFDDEMAWSASGGVASKFSGYLTVATRTEGSAANAINISTRMGTSRRYTGLAYVHLRYKLTGNSSKAESPFAQSITTRITIRGKAALLYDPREDSTVDGGSGSQRADDQSTWTWDDDACRNPALALLFYLLGWRINGELAVGKGIPPERIDLESFAVAANICDEEVDDGDGGTEPRYRCDGIWSEGDSPTTVMEMLKATMNADLDDVDGKLRLTVFHNDLSSPVADFTDDDILGTYVWEPAPSLDQTFNIVRGTFTDPSDNSLYQQVDYPEVSIASPDGIDRIFPLDLPMVQSPSQCQRIAALRLARQQYGGGTFKAEYQATAWKVQKNSVVRQTFKATGFTQKLFRVAEMDIRVDGVVPLTLREEHASIYGAPDINAPIDPVASTPYDPSLNPWLQQINSTAQVEVTPLRSYAADYTGAVISGLLPDYIMPSVSVAGVEARTADAVSYAIDTSGVTATVDNTNGSSTKGRITVSAVDSINGYIDLTVTVNGVAQPAKRIVTKREDGLPSGFGGSGAKIASDNSFGIISGTSFTAITDVLTVTIASGESLHGTAPLDYQLEATGSTGSRSASAKWQYSPAGAGTWTDFDTAITGSLTAELPNGSISVGAGNFTQTEAGLSAGDYDVRLVAALNTSGRTVTFSGTATVEAKP